MESKPWEYKECFSKGYMEDDYSGHYEVTNGNISLCTTDDPEDITETENTLQRVANMLNESGCKFYCDTTTEHALHIENMELRYKVNELKARCEKMADTFRTIVNAPAPASEREYISWFVTAKNIAGGAISEWEAEQYVAELKEGESNTLAPGEGKEVGE